MSKIVNPTYMFINGENDKGPTAEIQLAVGRGEYTIGGMAEAGWFLAGEMIGGGPIFSRKRPA